MNDAQSLHTCARRYCIERHAYWTGRYSDLQGRDRAPDGYHYTAEALEIFPRYNVLGAINIELGRLDVSALIDWKATMGLVCLAGEYGETDFTRPPNDPIAERAMSEERQAFCAYVQALTPDSVRSVAPLPHERVLTDAESREAWSMLRSRWRLPRGYWYPLVDKTDPNVEAFQDRAFFEFCGSFDLSAALERHGVELIWELREYGEEYERDLVDFDPYYNGAEGFWSSREDDWIIYASHESSITVGGWLLDEIKSDWRCWRDFVWTSPFF